jgi:protocatechuate 3,4-dioxygenase beta subunit
MKEIATEVRGYRRTPPGSRPPYLHPPYAASRKRAPALPLILLPHTLTEVTGPVFGHTDIRKTDHDLTIQHAGVPLGQRINVSGRLLDEDGRPVRGALIEVWQANAAGRYLHKKDTFHGPLDPNFSGAGRTLTDSEGRYRFITIRPGAYPWPNGANAWRPAHIHFSVFGAGLLARLVTQMYFPGDPLLPFDAIFNGVPDERARNVLVSRLDWETTEPNHALGYRFDIVLRGRDATPMET